MRLINCSSLQLEDFIGTNIPEYVILSHRWEEEEVSLTEFTRDLAATKAKRGFRKIYLTCRQAIEDGYQYAWVDTCCIDKTSSAELSEAINSMFAWYESSKKCYVYLSDVREADSAVQFPASKWFTRGWTLQELLAPKEVEFFDQDWEYFGTKRGHADWISEITGIDKAVLLRVHTKSGRSFPTFESFCVAKRMSWASRRETTRVEDTAYALLGIFNINMPLLYGEGKRAFTRLQEEILKKSGDDSILAWGLDTSARHPHGLIPKIMIEAHQETYYGGNILASSPKDFENCQDLVSVSERKAALMMTSVGLQIELPLVKIDATTSIYPHNWIGFLSCSTSSDDLVGIVLCSFVTPDDPTLRVERQVILHHDTAKYCSAIVAGPRAVAGSILEHIIIVKRSVARWTGRPFQMCRSQIYINKSDALKRTGFSCTEGTAPRTYHNIPDSIVDTHWNYPSEILSIDSGKGCEFLVSFRFQFPHFTYPHDSACTLFSDTEHRRAWVLSDKYLSTVNTDEIYSKMRSNSLRENSDSVRFYDTQWRPFELRVTFEETEIFKWRIFQINIDAEYYIPSNTPVRMDPMDIPLPPDASGTTSSMIGNDIPSITISEPTS
jgi:hypothetical protein